MLRLSCVLMGIVIPSAVAAWDEDGLRSGMSESEAMNVVLSRGEKIEHRVEMADRKGAYSLSVPGARLTFCSDVLYEYTRFLPGGFEAFVQNTERVAKVLGPPLFESYAVKSEISASWPLGEDRLSYAVSKDDDKNVFTFSRQDDDTSNERRCKR